MLMLVCVCALQSNLWYLFDEVRPNEHYLPNSSFISRIEIHTAAKAHTQHSRADASTLHSHFEWFAWCICTLLFHNTRARKKTRKKYVLHAAVAAEACSLHNYTTWWLMNFIWGEKCTSTKKACTPIQMKHQSEWHRQFARLKAKMRKVKTNRNQNEMKWNHVSIAHRKVPWQFSDVRLRELGIEIKELIPINFIAPVRLFSSLLTHTHDRPSSQCDEEPMRFILLNISCSCLLLLLYKHHHSSFFLWWRWCRHRKRQPMNAVWELKV